MSKATIYMLVKVQPGRLLKVRDTVRHLVDGIAGIETRRVDLVTGPYDIIIYLEGMHAEILSESLVHQLLEVAGVVRTMTCLVIATGSASSASA